MSAMLPVVRSFLAGRADPPAAVRTPWWTTLPALIILLTVFATWDDGATSLFLGAIVPLHVFVAGSILRLCPPDHLSVAALLTRLSLLVPLVLAAS
jgi:hypothetical protein